jgi:hypothetical protein
MLCSSSCFEELGSPLMTSEMLNNYERQKKTKPHQEEEEVSFIFSSFSIVTYGFWWMLSL